MTATLLLAIMYNFTRLGFFYDLCDNLNLFSTSSSDSMSPVVSLAFPKQILSINFLSCITCCCRLSNFCSQSAKSF